MEYLKNPAVIQKADHLTALKPKTKNQKPYDVELFT